MIHDKCINVKAGQEICSVFLHLGRKSSSHKQEIAYSKKFYRIRQLGSIFIFYALSQMVISLGMFYYWVYEGKISPFFQVIGLVLFVSCCSAFLIFLMSYKEFCQDNALQLIMFDPVENKNVLSIFEDYCNYGTSYITNENFDVNVRTWCDIGILRVALPLDNLDKIDSRIKVVISEKYIREYLNLKENSR